MASNKSLGTLTLNLLIQTGSFVEGMSKAERANKKFTQNVASNLDNLGKAFVGLLSGAAAAGLALIKISVDAAAQLDDISQTTGIAVEQLSALKYAAEFEGVAFDSLSGTLNKFSKNVIAAATGTGDAADAFKALNINLKNGDGTLKSTNDLIIDVAEQFAHMEDGATKAALAQKLFGKSGTEIIPFLNRGRDGLAELTDEAQRFGLIISTKTASAADAFNDNLHRLKQIMAGTATTLTADLLPRMVEFTDLVKSPEAQQAISNLVNGITNIGIAAANISIDVVNMSKALGEFFAKRYGSAGAAIDDLDGLNQQLERLEKNRTEELNHQDELGSAALIASIDAQIAKTKESIKVTEELRAAKEKAASSLPKVNAETKSEKKAGPDLASLDAENKLHEAALKKLDDYSKEIQTAQKLSEVLKLKSEIEMGDLKGISEADQKSLMHKAALVDITHQQIADTKTLTDYVDELTQAGQKQHEADIQHAKDRQEQFADLSAGLDAQIALYGDVSRVTKALYETSIGNLKDMNDEQRTHYLLQQETLDNLDRQAKAEEKHKKALEEQTKSFDEFGKEAARNVQDAFADSLLGVEGNFGDTLKRMAAEFTASALLRALGKFLIGTGSETLGAVGGFFAGTFATGGTIGAGEWGIVGETGPEIVNGPAYVTGQKKTESMMRGGGGNTYQVNISLPGIRDANEANMASASVKRAAVAGIREAGRYA